jgi:hypothetical protein
MWFVSIVCCLARAFIYIYNGPIMRRCNGTCGSLGIKQCWCHVIDPPARTHRGWIHQQIDPLFYCLSERASAPRRLSLMPRDVICETLDHRREWPKRAIKNLYFICRARVPTHVRFKCTASHIVVWEWVSAHAAIHSYIMLYILILHCAPRRARSLSLTHTIKPGGWEVSSARRLAQFISRRWQPHCFQIKNAIWGRAPIVTRHVLRLCAHSRALCGWMAKKANFIVVCVECIGALQRSE